MKKKQTYRDPEIPEGWPTIEIPMGEMLLELPIASWWDSVSVMETLIAAVEKSLEVTRDEPEDIRNYVPMGAIDARTWRLRSGVHQDVYTLYFLQDQKQTFLRLSREFMGSRVMFEHSVIGIDEQSIFRWYYDMTKVFSSCVDGMTIGWRSLVTPEDAEVFEKVASGIDRLPEDSLPN